MFEIGEALPASVGFVLTNETYTSGVLKTTKKSNQEKFWFCGHEVQVQASQWDALVWSVYDYIFCSVRQSELWYRVLFEEMDVQNEAWGPGSDFYREELKEVPAIEVELTPFHYMPTVGTYNRSPATCTSNETNVAEEAFTFWYLGFRREEVLRKLSFRAMEKYPLRSHGGRTR